MNGFGIDCAEEAAFSGIGIFDSEEAIVEADFRIDGRGGIDPMDGGFAFHSFRCILAGGVWQEFYADEGNFTRVVLLETGALDNGATTEADVFIRGEAEILFLGDFLKVIALDENFRG